MLLQKEAGKAQISGDGLLKPSTSFMTASMSKSGSMQTDASGIPIKVIVRVRPHSKRELKNSSKTVVEVVDDKTLIFDPKEKNIPFFFHNVKTQKSRNMLTKQNKQLRCTFDRIYNSSATNKDIFEGSIENLIGNLLDGYNCSVLTYGGTGAGKTHTMVGYEADPGITHQIAAKLFSELEKQSKFREFSVAVTYLEICNERLFNLLDKTFLLPLREDNKCAVKVVGLEPIAVRSAQELLSLFQEGNDLRESYESDANEEYSIHHAVFQVYINISNKLDGQLRQVKLSIIDLAASKRFLTIESKHSCFKEIVNIHKSLLALGKCINNLADGIKHVPYRDSKLTRILKDSLGGNCYTIMIANIGPSSLTYRDTYNTLKYTNRVKEIRPCAKENVSGETLVASYIKADKQMKEELSKSRVGCKYEILHAISVHNPHKLTLEIYCKLLKLYREKKDLIEQILPLESNDIILAWMLYITLQD